MLPPIDLSYTVHHLLNLLKIPSPTGFTQEASSYIEQELTRLDVSFKRTPKGALLWTLKGASFENTKAIASHIDTLGAMVKGIKKNGRLKLSRLGSYDWTSIEGAECKIHTLSGVTYSGTIINTKQSTHAHGPGLKDLKRTAEVMEVRIDADVSSSEDTRALGVAVGDFISFDSAAKVTDSGFIKGRHLDNKASVAISLAVTKALVELKIPLKKDLHFFVSTYEEVGHGAAEGIPEDVSELLCLDMAVVGSEQTSSEHGVTLCVKDSTGPYDYHMNVRLRQLALQHDIRLAVDIYPYYGSDASVAWRAGGSYAAALIGPGVDASHAYERTHESALLETSKLLLVYLLEGNSGISFQEAEASIAK